MSAPQFDFLTFPSPTRARVLLSHACLGSVLAQKLKWPFALPLLAAPLFASAGRRATTDAGDGAETARVLFAWAKAAAHACDLAAELRRRAQKLAEAAPKLRAKGAKAALQALLDGIRSPPRRRSPASPSAERADCFCGSPRSARSAN